MKKVGDFRVVNHSVQRGDGIAKVTGRAIYTGDIVLEGMAWAKVWTPSTREGMSPWA